MSRTARTFVVIASALALALLMLSFAAGAGPVEAQGSWTCNWDFTGSNPPPSGWAITHGQATASGYRATIGSTEYYAQLVYSAGGTTFTSISAEFLATTSVAGPRYIASMPSPASGTVWNGTGSNSLSWSGSAGTAEIFIGDYSSSPSNNIWITSMSLAGTGSAPGGCVDATPTPSNTPTPAPTATPATQTIVYDFSTGQHGWIPDNGITAYSAGVGFVSTGTTTETWSGNPLQRRPTQIMLCTENQVKVMSAELLISISGAANPDHNWSTSLWDGDQAGGSWMYNQDSGVNLTRTLSDGALMANPGLTYILQTADPGVGYSYTAFNSDVLASSYTIHKLTIAYATGFTPELCDSSSPPTVTLTCPAGDLTANLTYTFEAETTGTVTMWAWDFGDGNTSSEADGSVDFSWPLNGAYTVEVEVTGPGGTGSDSCEITILRVGDPGGGGGALYRPLMTTDTDTQIYDGLFSRDAAWGGSPGDDASISWIPPEPHTVIGFSKAENAPVFAVADGTVLSVERVTNVGCGPVMPGTFINPTCNWGVYATDLSAVLLPFLQVNVSKGDLWVVTTTFGEVAGMTARYYVVNAPLYVRVGQVLLAGCIVGETSPWDDQGSVDQTIFEAVFGTTLNTNATGVMWMDVTAADGQQVPVLAQMFVEPNASTACNAGGDYADCLFDPLFQNQGAYTWTEQGRPNWADGVTLDPGEGIALQGLTLDAATAYSFTVWTQRPVNYGPTDARITLGIGTTETSFFLSEGVRTPWAIASATHAADQGALYSLRIINSGRAPFTVLENCLTTGVPNTTPGSCYFQNYTFDGQLSGWSTTGTIVPSPAGPGALVVMSDLATIGQNVTLYADGGGGDHEYTVRLEGVLNGDDANSMITVRYRFGGGGWYTPSVAGWTRSQQNFGATNRFYVLEFDVPSGTFAGVMEFQFDFTAAGTDVIGSTLGLNLLSLCLQDAGGFGHHPGGGGSNWTPGMGCDNSAPPVELQDDFGAWISYHLNGMEDIYYCDVIPQLEQLNNITYSIYEYGQWTGLYSQAAQAQVSLWADKSLFPWLGGHLSNIARAAGGAIGVDVGGGCHDIFCLLESVVSAVAGPIVDIVRSIVDTILGLINTAVDVLLPLVEAIVGFFVQIIGALGGLLNSLITAITAFVTGIANAQPAPVPGLPNCAIDPSSNALCAVMYGLEQTVFADEGAAIIPLFIGLLAIVQLQWLIGKIGELIERVTGGI